MRFRADKSHEPVFLPGHADDWAAKTVDVTDAAGGVEVLSADRSRLGFCIVNTSSTNAVFVGAANVQAASGAGGANKGFKLAPGQALSSSQADGYCGEIRAICSSGKTAQLGVLSW